MKLVKPSFSIMAMSGHPELPYSYEDPLPLIESAGRTCYKTEEKIGPGTAEKFVETIKGLGHLSVMEHSWNSYILANWGPLTNTLLSQNPVGTKNDWIVSGNIRMFKETPQFDIYWKSVANKVCPIFPAEEKLYNHLVATVRFVCDRGVSHELVRHRIASYSQESTRYCDYSKDKFGNHVTFVIPPWLNIEEGETNPLEYTHNLDNDELVWLFAMSASEVLYARLIKRGWSPQQARAILPNSLKTEIVMTATWAEWKHVFNMRSIGIAGKPHPQMLEIMQPCHEAFKELESECFK